jgi:hypothetical protein
MGVHEHARRLMTGSMPADVPREPDQRGDLGGAPLPHDCSKGTITTDKASSRPLQRSSVFSAARRAERVVRGGRPARRLTELTSRWRGGADEGNFQGGHGRDTGSRWRVGSGEKWLYFSYTYVSVDILKRYGKRSSRVVMDQSWVVETYSLVRQTTNCCAA